MIQKIFNLYKQLNLKVYQVTYKNKNNIIILWKKLQHYLSIIFNIIHTIIIVILYIEIILLSIFDIFIIIIIGIIILDLIIKLYANTLDNIKEIKLI